MLAGALEVERSLQKVPGTMSGSFAWEEGEGRDSQVERAQREGRMKSVPGVAGRELGDLVRGAVCRGRSWQSRETIQRDRREL